MAKRAKLIGLAGALVWLTACSFYPKIDETERKKHRVSVGKSHAQWFGPSHESAQWRESIVIPDPIFLKRDLLHRNEKGGLIAWFNSRGHEVWLLYSDDEKVSVEDFGLTQIPLLIDAITKKSGRYDFSILAASLGGQSIYYYFEALLRQAKLELEYSLNKVVFLGTGLDYNYPGSFAKSGFEGKSQSEIMTTCKSHPKECGWFRSSDGKDMLPHINRIPELEKKPRTRWKYIGDLGVPALFVQGMGDSIAPVESVHPIYIIYGNQGKEIIVNPRINKVMMTAGKVNHHEHNYDHYQMFLDDDAGDDIYEYILSWMRRQES